MENRGNETDRRRGGSWKRSEATIVKMERNRIQVVKRCGENEGREESKY